MASPVLQFKRGVFANLPGLRAGEPGFTTDKYDLYVGLTSSTETNQFFGSARYWTRETTTVGSAVKVVEGSNNGSNFIALKSPDTLSQDYTYTLPSGYGTPGYVLQSDGSGGLTWAATGAASAISGVTIQEEGNTVGSAGSVSLINFVGEGITATSSGAGATITVNTATTSTLGVASFNSANFSVTDGAVSIANNAVGLGTNTYGQYAKSIVGGSGLSATTANADDGTDYTIDVNTGAGITITTDAVAFKNAASLTGNTIMKWDSGNSQLTNSLITDNGTSVTIGTGVGITQFSSSVSTGTSTSSVPTSSAIIDYVGNYVGTQIGNVDLTLGINADTGGPSTVSTSQTLTISGTANEVETSVSGQTITVGLPDAVVVGTSLSAPTVRTNLIKSQDTNATVITLTGNDATFADNLTVTGNLYVNGSTTQVNTTALTVEDRTIELGKVDGAEPADNTTWDLGILFNYKTSSVAKKSAVIWEHVDSRFKFATVLGADTDGTDKDTPQLTVTTFAPIEISALWVTDCAGTSQVISCTGTTRNLENITIDAGTF